MGPGKIAMRKKGREERGKRQRLGETRHREGKLGLEIEQQSSRHDSGSQNPTQGGSGTN